jgi:hypothetical protein
MAATRRNSLLFDLFRGLKAPGYPRLPLRGMGTAHGVCLLHCVKTCKKLA